MTTWTSQQLRTIAGADEIGISSRRPDGTVRPYVTIWAVRAGDDIYIRSAHGSDNPWYRRALASGTGRIRVGGIEQDVMFSQDVVHDHKDIDAAYHQKYDQYGAAIVGAVVGEDVYGVTLRVLPHDPDPG